MITQMFGVCNQDQHNTSETISMASRPEVPNGQKIPLLVSHQLKQNQDTSWFIS